MAKILIVDDELALRHILRLTLERAGHEVIEAKDGEVGAKILGIEKLDLMITDLIMPNREGIETIREARKCQPDLKIIAISGGGHSRGPDILDLAKKLGADRTYKKPFKPNEIAEAVDELLKQAN
ncbi:MAG TPA: response regulator [Sedimentisphaerales bacterium]|nr:response regulator [Sedimentisphaerales bacterium]